MWGYFTLRGRPQQSLFSQFRVTSNFSGGFWDGQDSLKPSPTEMGVKHYRDPQLAQQGPCLSCKTLSFSGCLRLYKFLKVHWEIKGGFVKGWFWRTYPRSGFRSGGTCETTLVPVFVPGVHPKVPSFRFSFRGNSRQNHRFGNHPFVQPQKSGSGPWQKWQSNKRTRTEAHPALQKHTKPRGTTRALCLLFSAVHLMGSFSEGFFWRKLVP